MQTQTIKYIEARNLGPINGDAVADFTQGPILMVKALNGQGKSFFGETLFDLLRAKYPSNPLHEGANEGYFRAVLDDDSEVLFRFDTEGHRLEFFLPNAKPMTQAQRKEFISRMLGDAKNGFDLNGYLAETQPKKRSAMLAKLVGLDFTLINTRIAQAVENRVIAGRHLTNAKARAGGVKPRQILEQEAGVEIPDAADIQAQVEAMQKANHDRETAFAEADRFNQKADFYRKQIAAMEDEIKSLEWRISELRTRITNGSTAVEDAEKQAVEAREKAEQMPHYSEEQIAAPKARLAHIGELHTAKAEARKQLSALDEVGTAEAEYETADNAVKALEAEKVAMITSCNIIDGLTFTADGDAIWRGRPIEDASTGEQVLFGIAIKKREAGDLRFMHIDCHSLDGVNIRKVAEQMAADGWTCLLEIPEQTSTETGLHVSVMEVSHA